jgi:hypothetical protein
LAVLQPVQQAVTSGPSRLPQVSLPPELLELVDAAPPAPPVPVCAPQTSVCGTHSSTCWPSALVSGVQARPVAQATVPQSGAQ